jgi:2-polyprenyl-3-methyl-5-hydroxy-6-metoxy-1,4-benzoquinol methylase
MEQIRMICVGGGSSHDRWWAGLVGDEMALSRRVLEHALDRGRARSRVPAVMLLARCTQAASLVCRSTPEMLPLRLHPGRSYRRCGGTWWWSFQISGVEVLGPAVGTGRVLIPLLQEGQRVRGFDSSPHMLSVCRANCAARGKDPVLFEEDMAFRDPGAFDAIVIPAGSFALVTGRDLAGAASWPTGTGAGNWRE